MEVLVTGATGFIGRHLVPRLCDAGHAVAAMTRDPARYHGPGTVVTGDIGDPASLRRALAGRDVAYYLVHSLASPDFADRDRAGARAFAAAARAAGVARVVYLGGLGDETDDLSPHLRSRREIEHLLASEVPTTVLRAGIVIGDGSISWELLRQLVVRLPAMLTPRWVDTRTQPIALDDALVYLVGVCDRSETIGQTYEIGGPEPLTYRSMLQTVARMTGRHRAIVPVPVLSPRLSSLWLRLITDVDLTTARTLVDSLTTEVTVHDRAIEDLLDHHPMSFPEAAAAALAARERRLHPPRPEPAAT